MTSRIESWWEGVCANQVERLDFNDWNNRPDSTSRSHLSARWRVSKEFSGGGSIQNKYEEDLLWHHCKNMECIVACSKCVPVYLPEQDLQVLAINVIHHTLNMKFIHLKFGKSIGCWSVRAGSLSATDVYEFCRISTEKFGRCLHQRTAGVSEAMRTLALSDRTRPDRQRKCISSIEFFSCIELIVPKK